MNILCIETSASICSVALFAEGENFYCEHEKTMGHAEVLTGLIQQCLNKADVKMSDLNAVALSGGPGSYTGLRIGCSSAKGICYALNIPLIIIDTLKIVAYGALQKNRNYKYYWAMMDARRMEVYHAIFNKDLEPLTDTQSAIITNEGFVPDIVKNNHVILCGDGASKAAEVLMMENAGVVANAASMCELASDAFRHAQFADLAYYEPFYLKQANITVSKS